MPGEKAPSLGAFLQASLKYFLSGKPMHNLSGVDTPNLLKKGDANHCRSVPDHDGRDVLEPAAGLDETREFWRQRSRIEVADDEDPHRVGAGGLVDFGDELVACVVVEGVEYALRQLVHFRIRIAALPCRD